MPKTGRCHITLSSHEKSAPAMRPFVKTLWRLVKLTIADDGGLICWSNCTHQHGYSTSSPVSSTEISDRSRVYRLNMWLASHTGQLNLLPLEGWGMSTGRNALMLCGWEIKGTFGWFHLCIKRVDAMWNYKCHIWLLSLYKSTDFATNSLAFY